MEEFYITKGIIDVLTENGCENVQTRGLFFPKVLAPIVVVKATKTDEG